MFTLIRFIVRTIFTLKLLAIGFAAGLATAWGVQLRISYDSWGLAPGGDSRRLPGDELVPGPDEVETRALDIDVAPEVVWPWLVQLGYGRGGWYAQPVLDRPWSPRGGPGGRSADRILEQFQDLAVGDVVPTHREGGFVVRELEPQRALVLYLDDAMMREQLQELAADASDEALEAAEDMDMPPFAVSWAFVLEELPGGRTRLVERLRFRVEGLTDSQRRAMGPASYALFALLRSQLQGIKRRAEAGAAAAA